MSARSEVNLSNLSLLSSGERRALQMLVDILERRFGEQLRDVRLFGSKARGEATSESDIDVLIILDEPTVADQTDARGSSFDVWMETDIFLSLRVMSQQAWEGAATRGSLFYRTVDRDGVSLLPVSTT